MAVVETGQVTARQNQTRTVKSAYPGKTTDGKARQVTTFTDKTFVQYSTPAEMFVPDWDGKVASEQTMARVARRVDIGQKKTPRGVGRNSRA